MRQRAWWPVLAMAVIALWCFEPGACLEAAGRPAGRLWFEERGIGLDGSIVLEGFTNFHGGLTTSRVVGASTADLSLSVDMDRLVGLRGGEFYADLADHAGENPSADLVGDLQAFDNLNSDPFLQILEMWYQQTVLRGKVRMKFGKVDAGTEYSVVGNAADFLNNSASVNPAIFAFPAYPDPMPGVNVFIECGGAFHAGFGAFYSNGHEEFGDFSGDPADLQPTGDGVFLTGETRFGWRNSRMGGDGDLTAGVWGHTGTFDAFDGTRKRGAYGYYLILDQTAWQPAGESAGGRGLRTFLEYGRTQRSISIVDWAAGGGIACTGPLSGRPNDVLGIGPQYAHISGRAGLARSYELSLEVFYKAKIARWAALTPDLQYIVNPGGSYPDALVGTLRLVLNLPTDQDD